MQYTLKIPTLYGEVIPLIRIAECMAMANPAATIVGEIPYHALSFENVYRDYGEDLLGDVSANRLKICNARGFHFPIESYIGDVTESWIKRMAGLFVELHSLNEWATKKGHIFTISNEGAEYVIGRSDENGKMEVAVYGKVASAPTLSPATLPSAEAPASDPATPAAVLTLPPAAALPVSTSQPAPASEPTKPVAALPSRLIDEITPPPGKIPKTSMGKLAIKAAWVIECEKKRKATDKEVLERLQTWADNGCESSVLNKSDRMNRRVIWMTLKSEERYYTLQACQKALEAWNKSR